MNRAVSLATRYSSNGLGFKPRCSNLSRPALVLYQRPIKWVSGHSSGS